MEARISKIQVAKAMDMALNVFDKRAINDCIALARDAFSKRKLRATQEFIVTAWEILEDIK